MNTQTVTRADLAEAVYREIGLSRSESSELVETVIHHISDDQSDNSDVCNYCNVFTFGGLC